MQIKKIVAVAGLCASLFLLGGCGKVAKLSNGDDAVVTMKDDLSISANELYAELKDKYALEALVNMIDLKILEKEFPDEMVSSATYAENVIKSMKEQYGDESKLLQAIKYYTSFSSIEGYQLYIYLSEMQNKAAEAYAKTLISEKDMKKYYEKEVVGDIEINHILITAEVKSDATTDEKTEAEKQAKNLAEDIIAKLNEAKKNNQDVKAKFEELAKEYSKDEATKDKGGNLGKINKDTLGSSYDELVNAAYELKDGEYSTKIITTELGYEIVYRSASYEKKSYEDAKDSIQTKLAKKLLEQDATVSVNALDYYRKKYKVDIQDDTLAKQYDNYLKNALSQAANANKEQN
jgi:foldase protein PrsA